MSSKSALAAFAAIFALTATVAASTALAQKPRPMRTTAAPMAVNQNLGMAIMSANVSRDGILEGGGGAVGASKQANGQYFVAFNRSVEGCTHIGAVSGLFAANYPGFVATTGKSATFNGVTYNGVQVDTSDHNALIGDRPFHLLVFCSK